MSEAKRFAVTEEAVLVVEYPVGVTIVFLGPDRRRAGQTRPVPGAARPTKG